MSAQEEPEFFTVNEVAEKLRVKPRFVRDEIKRGRLVATPVGGSYRIHRSAYRAYVTRPVARPG